MYDKYHLLYMENYVTLESLEKLVKAKLLTQSQIDKMVEDRKETYGF